MSYKNDREKEIGFTSQTAGQKAIGDSNIRELSQNAAMSYEDQVSAVASMWSGLRDNGRLTDADGREGLIHAIYTHTVSLVLQFQWSLWKPEQRNILECPMYSSLEGQYEIFNTELEERDQNWERLLKKTITAIRDIADKPWTNASITQLVKKELPQSYEECTKLKLWLLCEGGCAYLYRIYELAKQKQRGMLCHLIVNTRRLLGISDGARESSLDSNVKKAGFDQNVLDVMADMEMIAMNYSVDSFCIDKAKAMELSDGLNVVQRLRRRLDSVTKDFPMWKDCKHIIKTCSQMFVARLLTAPFTSDLHTLLYQFCVELIKITRRKDLSKDISKIMALACSAQHLHVCSLAARDVLSNNLPFVVENYVRALTAATNEMEEFRSDKKEDDMKNHSTMFSSWLLELAGILKENERVTAECVLTAFSLTPDPKMYNLVQLYKQCAVSKDIKTEDPWSESEPSTSTGWSRDSHSRNTFLVKTSERLWGSERPSASLRASIVSVEVLEGLGLNPDLCQDFIVLLSGPRVKTLSWDMKWEVLEKNCQLHIDKTNSAPTIHKELTSVLDSLHLHEQGPSGSDDEEICSGIEKGYEPVYEPAVVNEQPLQFRPKFIDDYLDDFDEEDAPSKAELAEVSWLPASMRQKIRKRHRKNPGKVPVTIKIKNKKHNTRSKKIKRKKLSKHPIEEVIIPSDPDNLTGRKITKAKHILKKPVVIKKKNNIKMKKIKRKVISPTQLTMRIVNDTNTQSGDLANIHSSDEDISLANIKIDNEDKMESISLAKILDSNTPPTSNIIYDSFAETCPDLENFDNVIFENPKMEPKLENARTKDEKETNTMVSDAVKVKNKIGIMSPITKLPHSVHTLTQPGQAGPLSSLMKKLSPAPPMGGGTKIKGVANVTTSSAELSKNIYNIQSSTAPMSVNSNQSFQRSTSKLIHFRKPNVTKRSSNASAEKLDKSVNKIHLNQDHMTEHEKDILKRLLNQTSLQITRKGESNTILNNFISNDRSVSDIQTKKKYVRKKIDKKPIDAENNPKRVPVPNNKKPETNVKISKTIQKKQSYSEPVANTSSDKTVDVNNMGIWDIGCGLLRDMSRFGRVCTANELLLTYAYSENFIDRNFDKFWLTEIDWIVRQVLLSFRHEDVNFINQGVVLFEQILDDDFILDSTGEIADEIRRKCRQKIKTNKVLQSLLNVFRRDSSNGIFPLRQEYCQSNATNLSEADENNFVTNSVENRIQLVGEQTISTPSSANSYVTKSSTTSPKMSSPKIIIDGRINIPKNSVTLSHSEDIQAKNTLKIQSQSSIRRLAKQTPLNSSFVCENVVKTPQSPWEPSIHEVENTKKKDVPDRSLLINQQSAPLPAFSSLMSRLKSGSQNSYNSVTYEHNGLGHQKNMDLSCSESLPNFQNMPSARDTSYTNISKVAISRAKLSSDISLHPVSHNINRNADITKQNYIERKNAISPSPNTGLASQEHSVVKMLLQRKIVMGQKYQNTYCNDSIENLSQEQSSSQSQDSRSHLSSKNERAQFQTDKDHHVHTKQVIQVVPSTNNRTPMLQIGSIRDDKISNSDFDNTSHDLSKTKMSSQLENLSYVQSNNKCRYENKLNSVIRPSVITAPILSQATEHQDVHSRNQKVPKGLIKPTGILKVTGKNASGFYVVSSTKATESKSSGSETHSRIDKTVYVPSESSIRAETKTNAQIRVDNPTYEAKTNISVNKIVSGSKMGLYTRQNMTQPELCRTETEKCTDTTHINTRISTDTNVPTNNKFSRSYACKKNRIISIDYPSDCSPDKVSPVDNCNFQKQTHKGKVIDQRKKISVLEDVPVTIEKVLNRSSGISPKSCINNLKQEQINRNKEDEKSKDVQHVLNNLPYITINKLSHKNEQPAEIIVDPALPASVIVNNKTPPKNNLCTPINNEAGEMLIGRKISFCNVSSSYLNNVTDQYRTQNQLIFDNESIVDKPNEQIKVITQQSEVPTKSLVLQKDISKDQNVAQCLNSNYLLNKVTKLPDVTIVAKSSFLQNVDKIEQFDHEEDAQKVDRPPKAQKSDEKTGPVKSTFPNTAEATEAKAKMAENNCIKQKKKLIQCFKQQQDAKTIMDRLGIPGLTVSKVSITKGGQPNSPKITENKSTSTQNCDSQKNIYCDSPTQESSFRSSECDAHQTKQELDEDNADERKMYEKHFLPNKKITIRENAYENDMYENQFLSDKEIRTDEKPKDILVLDREKLDSLTIQQKVPISPTAMLKRQKIKRRITDCIITSAQVISLPWYRCDEVTSDCISTCDKYSDDLSQTPTKLIKDDTSIATGGKALKHFDLNTPTKIEPESPSKNKQFIGKRPGPKSKTMLEKSTEVENTSIECVKYELPKKSTKHEVEFQSNSDESAKLEVRFQNSPETIIKQEIDIQNLPKDIPKEGMEYKNNCDQSIIQDIVLESTSDISPKHEMKLQINSKESPHEGIQFLNIHNSIETVPDITITNNPIKFRYVTTAEDKSYNENLRDDKNSDIESILENHIISKDISTPLGDNNELRNEGNMPDKMEDILDLEQFFDSIQETISDNTIIIKEVSTDTSVEDVLVVTDNESENDLVSDIDENMTDIESILENHVIVKSNIPTVESNIEEHPLVSEVDMQNDLECETMGDNDDLNHDCDIVTIIEVEHDVEDTSVPITNNTDIIPVNKEIVSEIHETESYTKNNISRNSRNVNIIQFQNDANGDIADVNSDEQLLLISKKPKTSDNSTVVGLKDDIKSMSTLSNSENKIHMSSAVSYLQSQKCEIYKEVVERNTENNILKSYNVKDTTNNIVDVNLNVSDTNIMLSKDTTSDKLIDDTELRNVSKSETKVQNIENTYLLHSVLQTHSDVYDKPTARHKENISEIQSQITHTNFVVNSTDSNNTEALTELKSNTTLVNETESENEIKSDTSEEIDDIVEKISDIDVILGNNHFKPVSNTRDIFARPENTEKNVCTIQHEPMTLEDDPITLNKTLFEIAKLNSSVIVKDVEHHQSSPEILNNTNNSTSEIIENKEWSQNCKPVENIKGKENVLESNISSTPIVTGTRRRKQKSHIVAKSNKKQTRIEIVQKRITRNLVQKSKLKLADKKKHMKRSLKEIVLKSEDIETKNIKKSLKDIVPKSVAIKRKKTLRDIVPKSEDIKTKGIKKSVNEKILNFDQIKPDIKKSLVETILKSEDTESVNSVPKKFHVEFPTAPPKSYFKVPLTTSGRARIINDDESRILLAHMSQLGEIDTDVQEVVLEDPLNIEEGHLEEQEGDSKLDLCAIKKKSNKEHPIDLTCSDDENDKISLKDKLSSVYSFPNNYLCHVKLNTKNKKKFNELIYPSLKNLICTPKIHRLSKAIMNKYMEKMESDSGETWATRKSLRNIAKNKNTKRVNKPKYTTPINSIENPCGETGDNQHKNKREMPQKTSEAIINSTTEETPSMVPNKKFITNIINIVPLKTAELSTVEEVVVSDSESDETSEPVNIGIKFKKTSYFRPLLTRAQVKLIDAIKDPRTKLKYYKRFTTVNRKKLNITSQLTEEVICLSSDDESEKSEKQIFSNTSITTQKNHKHEIQPATEIAKYVMPDIFESKAAKMVDLIKTSDTVKTLDSKKEVDLEKTADLIKNVDPKISVDLKKADPEIIVHSENIADEIAVIVDPKMDDLKIISPTVKTIVPNIVISNKLVDLEMKADTIKTVDSKDQLYSKKIDDTVMTINTNILKKTVDLKTIYNTVKSYDESIAESKVMKLPHSKIVDSKKTVYRKKSLDSEKTTDTVITTDFEIDDSKLIVGLKMAGSKKTFNFEKEADMMKTTNSKLPNFRRNVENTSDTMLAVDLKMVNLKKTVDSKIETDTTKIVDSDTVDWKEEAHTATSLDSKTDKCKMTNDLEMTLDLAEIDISETRQKKNSSNSVIVGSVIHQKQKTMSSSETTASKNPCVKNEICIELRNSINLNNLADTEQPKQTFWNILKSNITVSESTPETGRERIQICDLNVITKPPHREKRKSFDTSDEKKKRMCLDEMSHLNKTCNANQSQFFKTYSKKHIPKNVDSWLKSNVTLNDRMDILTTKKVVKAEENIQVETEKDKDSIESDPDSLYTDLGNEIEDVSRDSYLNIILPDNPLVGAVSIHDTLCWDSTESDYSQDLITIPCNDLEKFECNENTLENPDTPLSEDDKSLCSIESEALFTENTSSNKLSVRAENKILIPTRNSPIILDDSINNNCEILLSVPKKTDYPNKMIVAGKSTQQPKTNNNHKTSVLSKVKERTIGHKQPSQSNQDNNETKSKVTKKGFGNVSDRVYVTSGITESLFGISAAALSDIKPQPLRSSKDKENNLNATNVQVDSLKYRKAKKNIKSKGVETYLRPSPHFIDEFDILKKYSQTQVNNIFQRNILSDVLGLNNYNYIVPAKQTYMVQVVEVRQFHGYNVNQNSLTSANDIQTQQNENSPQSEDTSSNAPETPVSEVSEKQENVPEDSTEVINTVKKTVITLPEDITPPQSTGSETSFLHHDQDISQNCSNIDCNADKGDTKIGKNLIMSVNNYGTKNNIEIARSEISEPVQISDAKFHVESTLFISQKVSSEIAEETSTMTSIQNKIVENIEKTDVYKNKDASRTNFSQETSQMTQSVTEIDIEKSINKTAEEHSENQSYKAAEETIQIEVTATAGLNIEHLVPDEFLDIDNTQITEDSVDQVTGENCKMIEENKISDVQIHSTEAVDPIEMDEDPMMNIETNTEENCLITDSEVVEDDVRMLDTEITEDDYELSNIPEDDIQIDSQMIEDEFQMWDAQHNIPMANSEIDVDSTPMVDFTVPCAVISRASTLGSESQCSEPYDSDVNYRITDTENVRILESPLNEFLSFGTRERELQTTDVAYIDALNSDITELHSEVQDKDADKNIESEDSPFDYSTYPTIPDAIVPAIQSMGTEPQVQFVLTSARPKPVLVNDASNLSPSTTKNKDFHANSAESNGCQAAAANEKPTIKNAMLLQQALAQILPPLQNQSSGLTSHQNNVAQPLFRFIQQGRSTSVTLVDKGQQSTSNTTPQFLHVVQNKLSGTQNAASSLADSNYQHGNQVIHIVNSGNQAKVTSAAQLFKRVNLLTSLTNTQVGKEQKMVQFVCKSADGKSIHLNSPHRGMVFRLQPVEAVKPQTPVTQAPPIIPDPPTDVAQNLENKAPDTEQEIRSRSTYEENYAKFIRRATSKARKAQVAKARGLPKFNQAFGKATFRDNANENKSETEDETEQANVEPIVIVNDIQQAPQDGVSNPNLAAQLAGPPLLIRKSPQTVVQQIKQAISPAQPLQTLQGGVIYTRQIPMNLSSGKTINLITVPNSEDTQKQETRNVSPNSGTDSPIIQIIQASNACGNIEIKSESQPTGNDPNLTQVHPVVTQMRIRLPMLSKTPQMIGNARLVRPYLQIQRNVIAGQNQPVYQQLVLTTAAPQHTITTPPQSASTIQSPIHRSEPNISSSTLEQLREFDMVFEQVKERSTLGDTGIDTSQSDQSLIVAEPRPQSDNLYQHSQVVTTVVNKKIVKRTISRPMVTCSQSPPASKYTESSTVTTYEETQSTTYAETEAVTNYDQVQARENWESETVETNEESETITTFVESEPMRFVEAPPLNGYAEPEPLTYQELQPVNYDDSISQPMPSYSESDSIRTFGNSQSTYVETHTDSSFSEPLHVNTYQGSPLLSYSDTQQTSYTESQPTSTHSDSNDKSSEFSLARKSSKKKKKKTPNMTCMVAKTVPALSPTKLIPTIVAPTHRHPPMTKPPPLPKPQEDDETTQRILYILAEYKDQLENCPDKDRPAPRRRNLALPVVPGERKRKKGKKTTSQNVGSPSDDPNRTIGSEDSSCGTSQADYSENNQAIDMPSPLGSPSKASRRYSFQQDSEASTSGHQKSTNTEGPMMQSPPKATTAVLMPGNYLLPVSMMKGGQQITIVTNQGQKILTLPQGDGASNALFLQRLVGAATLKTVQGKPTQILRPVQMPTINTQPMNLSSNLSNPILSADVDNTPCSVSPKIFMDIPTSDIESRDMPSMKDDTLKESNIEPLADTVTTSDTGETNTTEPLTKKCKMKPKKPGTVNLIQLHSLGSTEGSPTKVFSVGNPAQLGSILQLASCKSSGTALKTAKLPDLGQSVMILRKHESTDQFVLETNDSSGNQEVKILPGLVARCGSGAIIAMKQQGKVDGKINSGENLKTGLEGQSSWRFMAASNVNSPISTSTIPSASMGTTSQGSKMKFVTHNIIGPETLLKDQQTAAALVNLKNKYNVMDKDVRFQKSLAEDCQDIDLNVPSTSDHFPETNMMFSPTPTESNDETRETNGETNKGNHGLALPHTDLQKDAIDNQVSTEPNSLFHTAAMVSQERCMITQDTPVILQDPSMDSGEGIVLRDSAMVLREPTMVLKESPVVLRESMVLKETPVLLRSPSMILREPTMVLRNEKGEPVDPFSDEGLGLMAVAAEMKGGRIMIDEEEFAREHPNTTFHSEELADEAMVQPFPIVPRGPITDNSAFHHALSKPVILSTEANEQNIEYRDTETMDSTNVYRDQIKIHDLNSGQSCVKSSKKSKPCVRKTAVKSSTFKVSENHLKKIIDTGFAVDLNVSKNEDRLKQLIDDSFGVRQTDNLKLPSPSSFNPDLFWESNNKTIKDDDSTKKPDAFDTLLNKPSTSITKKPKPINKMQLRINSVIKSPKKIISHTNKAISTADSSTPDVLPSGDETKKPPMRTYPSKRAVDARKQAEIVKQEPFATNNVGGLLNTIATSILCGLRDCGTTSTLIRTKEKIDAQTVPQKFNPSEITITKTGVKRFNLNGTVQIPKKKARVRKPVTSIVTPVTMTDSVRLDAQTFVSK